MRLWKTVVDCKFDRLGMAEVLVKANSKEAAIEKLKLWIQKRDDRIEYAVKLYECSPEDERDSIRDMEEFIDDIYLNPGSEY